MSLILSLNFCFQYKLNFELNIKKPKAINKQSREAYNIQHCIVYHKRTIIKKQNKTHLVYSTQCLLPDYLKVQPN